MSKTKKTKKTKRQVTRELEEIDKFFIAEYCKFRNMTYEYLDSFIPKASHEAGTISKIADHAGIILTIAHILNIVFNEQGE